jgi:hypothetical protein
LWEGHFFLEKVNCCGKDMNPIICGFLNI